MDQELKSYLESISGNLAELKHDMSGVKQEIAGIKQDMVSLEIRLREHTESVETRLLTEFWKWAKTSDARYRQGQAVVGALDDRVQAVEDRVADLERRRAS